MSPRQRASARAGPPGPEEARCRPGPVRPSNSALALDRLLPYPCPRRGPQSLADGFRLLAQTCQRSPKGSSPFDGSLRPDEPPDAGAASTSARRSAGGRSSSSGRRAPAAGACAREGRAIPSRQLPRMRQRSDRGMSQGEWTAVRLGRYSSITVIAVIEAGRV
jgi:hypothetical protein